MEYKENGKPLVIKNQGCAIIKRFNIHYYLYNLYIVLLLSTFVIVNITRIVKIFIGESNILHVLYEAVICCFKLDPKLRDYNLVPIVSLSKFGQIKAGLLEATHNK